ncbi:MAG: MFS transporter [Candidatus Thorarchaeota archaeon]|nr:MFS transporter [Candidatus Thorarchaeota archaeon]
MTEDASVSSGGQSTTPPRMRWLYVFAIGLGFFTTGVSWGVYNSYLPARFLPDFITGDLQNTIIGLIMVLDNIAALILQPYIGAKSDKVRTRFGRRMPFIMIGTPIAAVFFVLIAYGWALFGFWFMFAALTVFNVSMAFYRAPVVALMPDLVPSELRSKANGVINMMGGLGAIYAFFIASRIYGIQDAGVGALLGVTAEQSGKILAFLTTSIIMIAAVVLLFVVIKEPKVPPTDVQKEMGVVQAFKSVSLSSDKSVLMLMGAIFFWFFSYNSIETWFTKYGVEILSIPENNASFLLGGIAVSFVVFAIPAGIVAGKLGRKNTIMVGIIIMTSVLAMLYFIHDPIVILIVFVVGGIGWAFINVNSIVMIWQLLGRARLGAGTGIYYSASMSAAILGPFLSGFIFDMTSIGMLFPTSVVFMIVALLFMSMVRSGEVGDVEVDAPHSALPAGE